MKVPRLLSDGTVRCPHCSREVSVSQGVQGERGGSVVSSAPSPKKQQAQARQPVQGKTTGDEMTSCRSALAPSSPSGSIRPAQPEGRVAPSATAERTANVSQVHKGAALPDKAESTVHDDEMAATEQHGGRTTFTKASKAPGSKAPRDLFGFSCPTCDTRLIAYPEQAGQEMICPDCGTSVTVPKRPSRQPTRPGTSSAHQAADGVELDHYRLQPPEDRKRLLPPLVEVSEEELFAGEPGLSSPSAQAVPTGKGHGVSLPAADNSNSSPAAAPAGDVSNPPLASDGPLWKDSRKYQDAYHVACPLCETRIMVWPSQVGEQIKCPDCSTAFTVPQRTTFLRDPAFQPAAYEDEVKFLDEPEVVEGRPRQEGRALGRPTGPDSIGEAPLKPTRARGGNHPKARVPKSPASVARRPHDEAPARDHKDARGAEETVFSGSLRTAIAERADATLTAADDRLEAEQSREERLRQFLRQPYARLLLRIVGQLRVLLVTLFFTIWAALVHALQAIADSAGGQLFVVAAIPFTAMMGLLVAAMWSNAALTILEASANGSDELESPVLPNLGDAIIMLLVLGLTFAASFLPGVALGLAIASLPIANSVWGLPVCLVVSQCVCLPVLLLSHLSSEHFWDFFSTDVVEALLQRKGAWLRYGLVVVLCWVATLGPIFLQVAYWLEGFFLLGSLSGLVHARALGILAAEISAGPRRATGKRRISKRV